MDYNLFKNKTLVAMVICHYEIQDWVEKKPHSYDLVKKFNRVPEDLGQELLGFGERLYEKWMYPLNFTYSNRYGRLRSTIRFFKNIKESRRQSLIKIYRSKMHYIEDEYDKILLEYDVSDRKMRAHKRDFMNWVKEYMWVS